MDSLKRQMEALQSNSPGTGIGETTPANTPAWAAALDKEQLESYTIRAVRH